MVRFPIDNCGVLRAPESPWSYPGSGLVRIRLSPGATDWSHDALEAAVNICEHADVMVESNDSRLAAQFGDALGRRLRQLRGDVA